MKEKVHKPENHMGDLIIVNHNSGPYLAQLIRTIEKYMDPRLYFLTIIDNNSQDESRKIHTDFPHQIIRNSKNIGFSAGVNQGVKNTSNSWIIMMNPDILLINDSISPLIKALKQDKNAGIMAPLLYKPNGEIWKNHCHRFNTFLNFAESPIFKKFLRKTFHFKFSLIHSLFHKNLFKKGPLYLKKLSRKTFDNRLKQTGNKKIKSVDSLFFALCVISRKNFQLCGGLDQRYFLYFEDHHFSRKLSEMGLLAQINKGHYAFHHGGGCSKNNPLNQIIHLQSQYKYMRHFCGPFAYYFQWLKDISLNSALFLGGSSIARLKLGFLLKVFS